MSASFDFACLGEPGLAASARGPGRWMLGVLGFLLLVVGAVAALVLYLQHFEAEEEARRQDADVQWLEHNMQFHFRRLEEDLRVAARQPADVQGGLLWRASGVLLAQGWVGAAHTAPLARWQQDAQAHADNAQALASMAATARGLRRTTFAGPMRQAKGDRSDVVWMALPHFERGQFVGHYVVAIALDAAVQVMVPDWFSRTHGLRLVADDGLAPRSLKAPRQLRADMHLEGIDLALEVLPSQDEPATVPRLFLLVAMVFLGGMLLSLWALRRDVLKRQQVQMRLQAEVALRTAMENSVTVGLRAWDLAGRVLYVNAAFCRLVGYSTQELLGASAPMPYWLRGNTQHIEQMHRDVLARGTGQDGIEVQFQHRDGTVIDVLIHEAPLHTAHGQHIGWMSSVLDISERKRAQAMALTQQERLEATGRLVAVGEVASTLAHELNQPLGALSSFATGLLNRLQAGRISPQETEQVVQRVAVLAEKAGRIIQRVNAIARRREISLQPLDLVGVVQRMAPGQLAADTAPAWVQADELLIEHLLGNLLANAHDAASAHSSSPVVAVRVQVDAASAQVWLSVADNGPGVPEETQAHIFDAFFSSKEGGMGMGLAICRSIVEAHHGSILVERDVPCGGARFTVRLPSASVAGPAPFGAVSAASVPPSAGSPTFSHPAAA